MNGRKGKVGHMLDIFFAKGSDWRGRRGRCRLAKEVGGLGLILQSRPWGLNDREYEQFPWWGLGIWKMRSWALDCTKNFRKIFTWREVSASWSFVPIWAQKHVFTICFELDFIQEIYCCQHRYSISWKTFYLSARAVPRRTITQTNAFGRTGTRTRV